MIVFWKMASRMPFLNFTKLILWPSETSVREGRRVLPK